MPLGEIVLLVVVIIVGVYYLFGTPYSHKGRRRVAVKDSIVRTLVQAESTATAYSCKDLKAVRATGNLLQYSIWLGYTRVGKAIFIPLFKRASGLDLFGSLYLPEQPTLHPSPPRPLIDGELNSTILERLISSSRCSSFNSVADYVRAYHSCCITPTQVAERVVRAVRDSNSSTPPLRAIVDWDEKVILDMARESAKRWKVGSPLSLLDGVPVAVKGEFKVDPYPLRGGTVFIPELSKGISEAGSVECLRKGGALLIGMANLQELGTGALGSNPNKYHLHARNPYNVNHFAGGSSSGSAVCVAAGLCPMAIGSDSGGSIRIPASLCGVVGLKPTSGLLNELGHLVMSTSLYAHGPLAASVLDCAIALDLLSSESGKKMVSLKGIGETNLTGIKVGIYWEFFEHADTEVVSTCKAAVKQLETLGVEVKDIVIPELEETRVAHFVTVASEIGCSLIADVDKHFNELNLETLMLLTMGYNFSAVEYINAQKQRTRALEIMKHIFDKVDIIVTPATGIPAPPIIPAAISKGISDATASGQLMQFAYVANFTGIPGLVLPVGYTKSGLPVGMQLMGRWYEEHLLLQVGWALETSGAFPRRKPSVSFDLLSNM